MKPFEEEIKREYSVMNSTLWQHIVIEASKADRISCSYLGYDHSQMHIKLEFRSHDVDYTINSVNRTDLKYFSQINQLKEKRNV